jgi:DNA-binding XRE family transcriptional regulator
MKPFVNKIRQARLNHQARLGRIVTITEVAQDIGVSRQALAQFENGRTTPSLDTAFKLCDYYGIPLSELIEYEPEPVAA